jgi:hypothetical protein
MMSLHGGQLYRIYEIDKDHHDWHGVVSAARRRTRKDQNNHRPVGVKAVYSVKWRNKPFPWSYTREFKPSRRWFYHGTSESNIQSILNAGFQASQGGMLGQGVYAAFHSNKSLHYSYPNSKNEKYTISVMVYAPWTYCAQPGSTLGDFKLSLLRLFYQAIEVRTGAHVNARRGGTGMRYHEICVRDPRRVVPRFIIEWADR